MIPFDDLLVWCDPVARSGPECMAVDELLFRRMGERPLLRIYEWKGEWVSVGYFGEVEAARKIFGPEVSVVRRWTGGGIVDHRQDFTYSLMIPRDHPVAQQRGAGPYRQIHRAIVSALNELGHQTALVASDSEVDSASCFERPVAWDVVDQEGRKRAGAGQRRLRSGMLHQGSVQVEGREAFSQHLVRWMAKEPEPWTPPEEYLREALVLANEKYALTG